LPGAKAQRPASARPARAVFWIGRSAPRALDDALTRAWLDKNGGAERAKISDLTLSWTREQYTQAFDKVEEFIAAGDVYQINLTLKFHFAFEGDAVALYAALRRKQRVAYGAVIGAPGFNVLSLSPELFFRREGKHMSTRPMKGAAARPHAARGRAPQDLACHGREAARRNR
jgi:para-aminobenzoate synthetase/4-amino-4-deoxychorismate lyase